MTHEQRILDQFCWEHVEFANRRPSLHVNLWGDILYDGKIIAESDLHNIPLDKLGTKLPTSWSIK